MKKYDRELIKRSFSRAAASYDSNSGLQEEVAGLVRTRLKKLLPEGGAGRALDLGCGTGALAIEREFPHAASVYGCDIARPMLVAAREKRCAGRLIAADMERLPFRDSAFDTVASSLAFQWAVDTGQAFKEARRVLKPGGVLCFSTLGPLTLYELKACIIEAAGDSAPQFMEFAGVAELYRLLREAGFGGIKVERLMRRRVYEDLMGLLKTLKNIGAANPMPSNRGERRLDAAKLEEASAIYSRRFPAEAGAGVRATYEIIIASAQRPAG